MSNGSTMQVYETVFIEKLYLEIIGSSLALGIMLLFIFQRQFKSTNPLTNLKTT